MGSSDANLLEQANRGDEHALTALLSQHGPAVRRVVARNIPKRWRSMLTADDVMQQTYIDAFLDLHRFKPDSGGSFPAWLTSLAKCNLADALKMLDAHKRGKGHCRVESSDHHDSMMALYELLAATQSTPSRHAARAEARAALARAIEQLPEDYGLTVRMYDLEGRPIDEIAAALKRSTGAVYMMRARAHRRLGVMLGSASGYLSAGR